MESKVINQKTPTPSDVGFFTQINNPVNLGKLAFASKQVDHSKNNSEFNLPNRVPDSNYYQLSRPKKSFNQANYKGKRKYQKSQNYYSKKNPMAKSTHSSINKTTTKANKLKKKKGNSVIALKSQNKFTFSGSVQRKYGKKRQYPTPWRKHARTKAKSKNKIHHKQDSFQRKRRDTIGVKSLKAPEIQSQSVYSKEIFKPSSDIRSLKKIANSFHKSSKSKKNQKYIGQIYSKQRAESYLTSSATSELFDQESGHNLILHQK